MKRTLHARLGPLTIGATLALAILLTISDGALTPAQVPTKQVGEELRKLEFLIGEWKGEGWKFAPDGKRITSFSQKTKVQLKEKERTLRVKDSRTYKPVISTGEFFARGTPILQTSALDASIYYDEALKMYRWRGENSYGRKKPLEASLVRARTLQYGMPFSVSLEPAEGNRRTTIGVTENGDWQQTLEVWYQGRWFKSEESVLKRVK